MRKHVSPFDDLDVRVQRALTDFYQDDSERNGDARSRWGVVTAQGARQFFRALNDDNLDRWLKAAAK